MYAGGGIRRKEQFNMARFPSDYPTNPGHRQAKERRTIEELETELGKLMADQARLRSEFRGIRKDSLRPPPVIKKGQLSAIVAAAAFIASSIITVLRELGVLK